MKPIHNIYKIGGCVRDSLLGIKSKDIDFAFDFIQDKFGMTGLIFSDGFNWTFDLRWVEDDFTKYPSINFPKSELERIWSDTYKKAGNYIQLYTKQVRLLKASSLFINS